MIVIVEGIDRVGKTTLCNKLKEELNIPIHKCNNAFVKTKDMDNYNESDKIIITYQILKETNSSIILDRNYLSDYVYGTLERKYNENDANKNFNIIDDFVSEIEDVFLILVKSTDINRSSEEHGKDLSKHEEMFENIYRISKIKNKWRCTYNTLDEAILFIKSKGVKNER